MAFMRAQVSLPSDSAEPRDAAVNMFHFKNSGLTVTANVRTDVFNALAAFYGDFDEYLSSNLATPARVKIYDMGDPPPRFPQLDATFTVTMAVTTPGVPNEVAACLSYQGEIASGVNRRRNRGRIYIGPVDISAVVYSVGQVRPSSGFRTALANAAGNRLIPVPGTVSGETIDWCVFSRSNALGLPVGTDPPALEPTYTPTQLLAGFRPVATAWVDDAFDTQRRRGPRPTTRTMAP